MVHTRRHQSRGWAGMHQVHDAPRRGRRFAHQCYAITTRRLFVTSKYALASMDGIACRDRSTPCEPDESQLTDGCMRRRSSREQRGDSPTVVSAHAGVAHDGVCTNSWQTVQRMMRSIINAKGDCPHRPARNGKEHFVNRVAASIWRTESSLLFCTPEDRSIWPQSCIPQLHATGWPWLSETCKECCSAK